MTVRTQLLSAAKCGFLVLLLACLSVLILLMFSSDRYFGAPEEIPEDDVQYKPYTQTNFSMSMLDDNFVACLLRPLNSSDIAVSNSTVRGSSLKVAVSNVLQSMLHSVCGSMCSDLISSQTIKAEPILKIVKKFVDLLYSLSGVDLVLLEPSVLFCMLSPLYKDLLLKRNFYLRNHTNQDPVLTFGVRAEHVAVLENTDFLEKMQKRGFTTEFVKEKPSDWMDAANITESQNISNYTSHIFYKNRGWTLHVVVLYERGNFLWHAALPKNQSTNNPSSWFYFAERASAYENFSFVSLGLKEDSLGNIHIPSDPQYLLFEMSSSTFLECNTTIASYFNEHSRNMTEEEVGWMPDFERRTVEGMQEMKSIFHPLMMHLWIWSGTMLGWYRQCGLIPYTSDVDFAAWAAEVDDLDILVQAINESEHIYLVQRMGVAEAALEFYTKYDGLRLDIFFLYQEANGTWSAGHRPSRGYYFKCYDPSFNLCSGELLGQKVTVPCETELVISQDYGANWMEPVESWNYESSVVHRGPNIYWDEEMLKKVYWDAP